MIAMQTERLLLREWEPDDWLLFRPIATHPEVMRYIGAGDPWDDERIRRFVRRQIDSARERGYCLWKLDERTTGRLVGFCGF